MVHHFMKQSAKNIVFLGEKMQASCENVLFSVHYMIILKSTNFLWVVNSSIDMHRFASTSYTNCDVSAKHDHFLIGYFLNVAYIQ